jgi:hypothetical protein
MEITWRDLMEDYFGVRLSADKATRWLRLMAEPDAIGSGVSPDELKRVVVWVRKKREGDEYRKTPTLETLIGWVKWYRKETAAARRGYRQDSAEGLVDAVKQAMLKAPDHDARLTLLYDGLPREPTDEERRLMRDLNFPAPRRTLPAPVRAHLRTWLRQRWPDWEAWLGVEMARRHDEFGRLLKRLNKMDVTAENTRALRGGTAAPKAAGSRGPAGADPAPACILHSDSEWAPDADVQQEDSEWTP